MHLVNKSLVLEHWNRLDDPDPGVRATATDLMSDDVAWHGHVPVGSLYGATTFLQQAWEPLRNSFANLQREPFVFFAGTSNGRIDGDITKDGNSWVTATGVLHGTFVQDYLGIPACGGEVAMRWGEFCRISGGKIDAVYFLIDVIDLMQQVGLDVLPNLGVSGQWPAPAAGDGMLLGPQDDAASTACLDRIRGFIFEGLNEYVEGDLESMGLANYFHPDLHWYGPGGIGACLSFKDFEDVHQRPWLVAYPDRRVQDLDALFAEGGYCGGPGWAGVKGFHGGPYRGAEATGKTIDFNGLDWWKMEGDRFVENWVFVDMVHLFDQMGVDLFERMRSLIATAGNSAPLRQQPQQSASLTVAAPVSAHRPATAQTANAIAIDLSNTAGRDRDVRSAVRRGNRTVEVHVEAGAWDDQVAAKIALRRVIEPARDARVPITLMVSTQHLADRDLVIVGHLASQLRVATVRLLGGDMRSVAVVQRGANDDRVTIHAS